MQLMKPFSIDDWHCFRNHSPQRERATIPQKQYSVEYMLLAWTTGKEMLSGPGPSETQPGNYMTHVSCTIDSGTFAAN